MNKERIETKMHELELKLGHKFEKISLLAKAMGSIKRDNDGQGKNASEYENEGLAIVGDALLKFVIVDKLFNVDNIKTKGKITEIKSYLENNLTMHNLMKSEGLINYAYNNLHFYNDEDIPEHEKVVARKHDIYVEAIVGAIFYDSDYDTARKWILERLLPLLEKYKQTKN